MLLKVGDRVVVIGGTYSLTKPGSTGVVTSVLDNYAIVDFSGDFIVSRYRANDVGYGINHFELPIKYLKLIEPDLFNLEEAVS